MRDLCGFGDDVPHRTTFNRFIQRLSHHAGLVEAVLADVTDRLKEWLPGLGDEVAVDSTAVRTHSNPKHVSDSDAEWGVKHSAKAKEGGTEYFFGFKVHMVADATYEVPLGPGGDGRQPQRLARSSRRNETGGSPVRLVETQGGDCRPRLRL